MSTYIYTAIVRDTILETADIKLVVCKQGTDYIGPLFFEKDFTSEIVTVLTHVATEAEGTQLVIECYEEMRRRGIKTGDRTLLTMLHWAYINGVSDEIFQTWSYENDEQALAAVAA